MNKFKIIIDVLLFIITVLLINIELTGNLNHEILGVTLGILIIIHIVLNFKWIKQVTKNFKKVNFKTKIMYLIDIFTMLIYFGAITCGILISNKIFHFKMSSNLILVLSHLILGRLANIIMFIHLGLHLDRIFVKIKNRKVKRLIYIIYIIYIIIAFLFAIYLLYTLTHSFQWLYIRTNHSSEDMSLSSINENTKLPSNSNIDTDNNIKQSNDYIEIGSKESKGFIVDNVLHSEKQGEIHFASYLPNNYDESKEYAIYFALPGWEGLYFQGIGTNLGEPFPFEAQKYNKDMIIISPQLDDWGEESANDTIALVEYFLENYNIDKSKVYISGVSGGGETLSIILGKRPELFTAALYVSSQWDGNLEVLANARTPLYMVIGENDSYYGSGKTKIAYNSLYKLYEEAGLTKSEIDNILVLDVKDHTYFTSRGYSDEHAGCGSFAYEENIMNWIFTKSK